MRKALLLVLLCAIGSHAQVHRQPDAAKIKQDLRKLNMLGSVIYMAAHPDDENTRAIAYLVNDRLAATAYLSLTRGDGGQNLIGPEIRDQLGLLRTQELLSARRLDGGQQYFTRAIDFGFSKTATETLNLWNRKAILSDILHIFREFQPDVIITRFPPDSTAGHGQHTTSAILAREAFDAAADPTLYPDQVKQFGTWKPRRLLFNTSWWWNDKLSDKTPGIFTINMGGFNTLLGKSYSELAAESRSQHKSQGFGSSGKRGDSPEYFETKAGDPPILDLFDGINITWTRVKGGERIKPLVDKAIQKFNIESPASSIPALLEIRKAIASLAPGIWRTRKLNEVNSLIQDCLGLFAEVSANHYWMSPGEQVGLNFELLNRSDADVRLTCIQSKDVVMDTVLGTSLKNNVAFVFRAMKVVDPAKKYSSPYWLNESHDQGLFSVTDASLIGKPENDPAAVVHLGLKVIGEDFTVDVPVAYKETDPVKGEVIRPFEIVPPVFVNLAERVYVFPDQSPREVSVVVRSASDVKQSGWVRLSLPASWKAEPAAAEFTNTKRGEEHVVVFHVIPGGNGPGVVTAIAELKGKQYDQSIQTIAYDHIPVQTLLPKAEGKVLRIDLKKEGAVIAYIRGAGDDIPAALRNMGYQVWEMKDSEVTPENLRKVDAVVLGVRAFNTNERIRYFMPDLLEFVKSGGTLVTQYNTPTNELQLDKDKIAPYALSLSRERVTEESSEVRILRPDHAALNVPNKITADDFKGWVQERGLYFADKWAPEFEPLISCNDTGGKPLEGGLLAAKYGNGYYVYTSLSFFRELPEGVPGAYRLFANLVSLSKTKRPDNTRESLKSK